MSSQCLLIPPARLLFHFCSPLPSQTLEFARGVRQTPPAAASAGLHGGSAACCGRVVCDAGTAGTGGGVLSRDRRGGVAPRGCCRLQAGSGPPRELVEGKVLVFDDSWEHQAWADADRMVLIVDVPRGRV